MAGKFKSTLQFDVDFKKFCKKYWYLFWLDEILKLHGFLETYGFEYTFQMGYQADRIYSKEEMDALFTHMVAELPWVADCTTRFDYLEMGVPKDLAPLFKRATPVSEEAEQHRNVERETEGEVCSAVNDAQAGRYADIPPLSEVERRAMTVGEMITALQAYDSDRIIHVHLVQEPKQYVEVKEITPVVEMDSNQLHPVLNVDALLLRPKNGSTV